MRLGNKDANEHLDNLQGRLATAVEMRLDYLWGWRLRETDNRRGIKKGSDGGKET